MAQSLSVVACDLCLQPINSSSPRIHCLDCYDFDSCAACYLQGYTTPGHNQQLHRQEIHRPNGFTYAAPALPSALETPQSALPSRSEDVATSFFGNLLTPGARPSPKLTHLANDFFTHVDDSLEPRTAGALNPKKYYHAHELMGESPAVLAALYAQRDANIASAYLARRFHLLGCQFSLDEATDPPTALLSRDGFVTDLTLAIAADPDYMYRALNRTLAYLRQQSEGGLVETPTKLLFQNLPIPRRCFPAERDPEITTTVQKVEAMLWEEMGPYKIMLGTETP